MSAPRPQQTYALIVGVEKYDAGPQWNLDGPAHDASKFTDWLLARQVPAKNIHLFLSPLDSNAALLDRKDPTPAPATSDNVTNSITRNLRAQDGDLLYIFWAGHGILNTDGTRRLFYADATKETMQNLDLTSLLNSLNSHYFTGFPQQIGFVDACANQVIDLGSAYTLPTVAFARGNPVDPPRDQFVLLSAKPGDLAKNITSRQTGLFTEALLEELNRVVSVKWPPDIAELATKLDQRFVDLRNKGTTEQTPTYFWFRGLNYQEGSKGSIPDSAPPIAEGAPPTATGLLRIKIKALKNKLQLLVAQYEAVSNELLLTLDPATGVILGRKLTKLEADIEESENELRNLEAQANTGG